MSEAIEKRRQSLEFEDFKKHQRGSQSRKEIENGLLAELARLVDRQKDPNKDTLELQSQRSAETCAAQWEHAERGDLRPRERILKGDFASIEAWSLRTNEESEHQGRDDALVSKLLGDVDEGVRWRRPLFVMAAIIIVGVAGLTASFVSWSDASSWAETELAKLQSETTTRADVSSTQDDSISSPPAQPSPAAIANNVERSVDVSQAQEKTTSTTALRGEDNVPVTEAAVVPAPSAQMQKQAQPSGAAASLDSTEMRTATIRPDDTSLRNDARPQTTATVEPPPASQPAARAPASKPEMATRVKTAPKPPAPVKLGDQSQRVPITNKAKVRAAATVDTTRPTQVADAQAETSASQPSPAPRSSGPLAFIQRATDSITGVVKNWGRIATGSRP
jgi:hypothetical protein